MRVRFWGTRGSIATPGPGTVHFGGNTSCVELTTADERLIFDCGTGARALGATLMATASRPVRASILLGHMHWDHIQGFPFFAPIFVPGNTISVYAPEGGQHTLHSALAGQMEYTYFPVELDQLPATIFSYNLAESTYEIGGLRVVTQYLHHPAITLGYRVEAEGLAVVYLSDHEPFFDQLWRADAPPGDIASILHEGDRRHALFMRGADLIIHDAQYTPEEYASKKTWGHSHFAYVVEVAAAAGVRRVALTHHDPTHDDLFLAELEQQARAVAERCGSAIEVFCAYEGYEVVLTALETSRQTAEAEKAAHIPSPVHGARILVADDDPLLRRLAVRVLTRAGHTVEAAHDGLEALRIIQNQPFDLLVLDLDMPGMGGLELLQSLRHQGIASRIPVLILTATGDEHTAQAGFATGANDYLTKPFAIPQLLARVHACLTRTAPG